MPSGQEITCSGFFFLIITIIRSVTEAVSRLESSLQEKQKEAITPWASDSPLVPWLISSVLFNLAAGVHYLTTNTLSLEKITSTLERATTQHQTLPGIYASNPEHQSFPEKLGTMASSVGGDVGMNLGMAMQLVQEVLQDETGAEIGQQMTAEQAEGMKQMQEPSDNTSHMQLESNSRPMAMRLESNEAGSEISSKRFGQLVPSDEQWVWGGAASSSTDSEFDWSGRL